MSIIYSTIAKVLGSDVSILCDYDLAHGNYPGICLDILKKASKIALMNAMIDFYEIKDFRIEY